MSKKKAINLRGRVYGMGEWKGLEVESGRREMF